MTFLGIIKWLQSDWAFYYPRVRLVQLARGKILIEGRVYRMSLLVA